MFIFFTKIVDTAKYEVPKKDTFHNRERKYLLLNIFQI